MYSSDWRKEAGDELDEPLLGEACLLAAPPERCEPEPLHLVEEPPQSPIHKRRRSHETEFEQSCSCRFGLRIFGAILIRLVRAERYLAVGRESRSAGRSPLTPVSVAGVARRHYRRAAIGTAAVVGAGAYYGGGYHGGAGYYSGTVRGARAAYYGGYPSAAGTAEGVGPYDAVRAYHAGGPWYGYNGWDDYAGRNAIKCTPGGMTRLDDGLMYRCQ